MLFKGKKILFIAPKFHAYECMIKQALEERGAIVSFYPERSYSILYKIIHHLSWNLLIKYQNCHYKKIIEKTKNVNFDYLFIIRGFLMDKNIIKTFRILNPDASIVMYQWDSNNTNKFNHLIELCDIVKSFDFEDVARYNIEYLPLFYTKDIEDSCNEVEDSRNELIGSDFFFMGSYIPERYSAIKEFNHRFTNRYKIKSYIYINKTQLIKEIFKGKNLDWGFVSTRHMSRPEYIYNLKHTKIMVDVSCRNQTGIAMRVIEALALRKKILTDNKNIVRDPLYNENNILIFDAESPEIPEQFISEPFTGVAPTLNLDDWLTNLFK